MLAIALAEMDPTYLIVMLWIVLSVVLSVWYLISD